MVEPANRSEVPEGQSSSPVAGGSKIRNMKLPAVRVRNRGEGGFGGGGLAIRTIRSLLLPQLRQGRDLYVLA